MEPSPLTLQSGRFHTHRGPRSWTLCGARIDCGKRLTVRHVLCAAVGRADNRHVSYARIRNAAPQNPWTTMQHSFVVKSYCLTAGIVAVAGSNYAQKLTLLSFSQSHAGQLIHASQQRIHCQSSLSHLTLYHRLAGMHLTKGTPRSIRGLPNTPTGVYFFFSFLHLTCYVTLLLWFQASYKPAWELVQGSNIPRTAGIVLGKMPSNSQLSCLGNHVKQTE